ncbi:MAG TPA: hypothetical protein VGM10_28530 [Actinocrinis sp.]
MADPRRLFGALPGAVVEAVDAHGAAGRLRLRVGQQTVTFRGIARIVEVDEAAARAVVELEAAFGRNGGGVDGRLEIRLQEDGAGTLAVIDGTLEFAGTAAPPSAQSLEAAGHRLVKRWFATLAQSGEAAAAEPAEEELPATIEQEPSEPDAAEVEPEPEPELELEPNPEPEALSAEAVPAEPEPELEPESADPQPRQEQASAEAAPTGPELDELARPAEFASRPPLAVVPDLDPAQDESAGRTGDQTPLPQRRNQQKPPAPAKSRAAENVSGGAAGRPRAADFESGSAAVDRDSPARLHLVQPSGGEPDHGDEAADEPDIWSRRKPFLPRWLPYLAGATFVGAVAFLVAVLSYLRRLRRARQAGPGD